MSQKQKQRLKALDDIIAYFEEQKKKDSGNFIVFASDDGGFRALTHIKDVNGFGGSIAQYLSEEFNDLLPYMRIVIETAEYGRKKHSNGKENK